MNRDLHVAVSAALAALRAEYAREFAEGSLSADFETWMKAHGISAGTEAALAMRWDDAAASFGAQKAKVINAHVGPLRPYEGSKARTGWFVLRRDVVGSAISAQVAEKSDDISNALFGVDCQSPPRDVEFYDILDGSNELVSLPAPPIAIFTPFLLDGWEDTDRQWSVRRTILLSNNVEARFRRAVFPLSDHHLRYHRSTASTGTEESQDRTSRLDDDRHRLREAIALWLSLHELLHAMGPVPLFSGTPDKLALGRQYGFVEESRADMSAFLVLNEFSRDFGEVGKLAGRLILADRLLRSPSQTTVDEHTNSRAVSEVEVGRLWIGVLKRAKALTRVDDCLVVDEDLAVCAVREFLGDLYEAESGALTTADPKARLLDYAATLRGQHFCDLSVAREIWGWRSQSSAFI